MPFKSKAQQRWMFATNPEKAKEWADETKDIKGLPEKKHPEENPQKKKLPPMEDTKKDGEEKKASAGLFFEKRSQSAKGTFFRDLAGREDATFHEKSAQMGMAGGVPSGAGMNVTPSGAGMSGTPRSPQMFGTGDALKAKASTMKPTTTSYVNPGATGMPPGNAGEPGQAAGGGMYGAGEGAESSEEDTLKALLGKSVAEGDGEKRTPKEPEDEKTAAIDPSDWDTSMGMPTGFHRPTSEQPEALEPGGERFHSTDGKGADYGAGEGMRMKATSGHQLGKHASANSSPPRFLGTSFAMDKLATGYASERSHEFTSSLGEAARGIGRAADEGVKSVTKSPAASLIAAVLLGRLGFKGAKGAGRLGLRGIRRLRGKAPPVPKSTAEKLTEGAKSVGRRLGIVS